MPTLIELVLVSAPFVVFVALVIETFRDRPSARDGEPVDLLQRSFGA